MKNVSRSFLVLSFFLFQSTAYGSGIILRGLIGASRAGARQAALWAGRKAKEDPQVTAGAATGAYVGWRVSEKDSKIIGAVAGAFVGAKLVKNHKTLKTLKAQLQAQTARVSLLSQNSVVQFATMEAQLSGLGRNVEKLGEYVANTIRKNATVSKRTSVATNNRPSIMGQFTFLTSQSPASNDSLLGLLHGKVAALR